MRKIAFFGINGHSRYPYSGTLQYSDGMPRKSGSSLYNALELFEETGNKGNMIHGEAPARIFKCDRHRSCYVSARQLVVDKGWSPERVAAALNAEFDMVVFSTANAIRPDFNHGGTAQILDALHIDFVVLGMGMQNPLPANTEQLHPELTNLLDVCNRKAKVFGVRGLETESWLRAVGYVNAKALGCPSMYVYPKNIMKISAPDLKKMSSAITGGYISARIPRATALVDLFKKFAAHYVMQDEVDALQKIVLDKYQKYDLYDDATGELNKEVMQNVLAEIHYRVLPFKGYHWFLDPNAWRSFASQFDLYIGDRLHGGIVALQCGVPSVFISEDQRVTEVTSFYQLPKITVEQLQGMDVKDVVSEYLGTHNIANFKESYLKRYKEFEDIFTNIDMPLVQHFESIGIQQMEKSLNPRVTSVKSASRRIIKKMASRLGN